MSKSEIISSINKILEEEFEIESGALIETADLYKELELDSLDAVDLVVALEGAFSIKIKEEKMREIHTLQELYQLIEEHQN